MINKYFTSPPPPNHQMVMTEDGSMSIYSLRYEEATHSRNGATGETLTRFIEGCKIADILHNDNKIIFEVGWGTSLGFLCTLDCWLKSPQKAATFISSEIDRELIEWTKIHSASLYQDFFSFDVKDILEKLTYYVDRDSYELKIKNLFHLIILPGDILQRQELMKKSWNKSVHAIFQDAYSPKKNPTLWTLEWFEFLYSISHPEVILSTYSSSQSVRQNMKLAGWFVEEGPKFGEKKSSTIGKIILK